MIVRIRLQRGRPIERTGRKNRGLALASGALLLPAALMAYVLGAWRLMSDMGMAGEFVIPGLFSHWQIWIAVAVLLHLCASTLTRYGRGEEVHFPRVLTFRMFSLREHPERKHAGEVHFFAAPVASERGSAQMQQDRHGDPYLPVGKQPGDDEFARHAHVGHQAPGSQDVGHQGCRQ